MVILMMMMQMQMVKKTIGLILTHDVEGHDEVNWEDEEDLFTILAGCCQDLMTATVTLSLAGCWLAVVLLTCSHCH